MVKIQNYVFDADLTEDVFAMIEFQNTRIWGAAETQDQQGSTAAKVNRAYVQFKEFLGMPASLKLGRQNFVLGSGLIFRLGDYDSEFSDANASQLAFSLINDSIASDGARMIIDLDPITIDLAFIKRVEGSVDNRTDDETYYAVEAQYAISEDATVAGYVVARDANATASQVYVYGVRGKAALNDSIDVFGEFALQRDTAALVDREAQLLDVGMNYKLNDAKNTKLGLEYMFASGDRDDLDDESNMWDKGRGGLKTGMMGDIFLNHDANIKVYKLCVLQIYVRTLR